MGANRLIVIEGPIGVGKTTLAQLLASELRADLVLEKVEENPFLPLFYQNPDKWAFQTQLFFLLSRARQLEELLQQSLYAETTISDYFFPKDRIFAYMNLREEELVLYEQIYKVLNPHIPKPDLVIFLQAHTEALLDRIEQRGRHYEKEIRPEYLRSLNEAYNRFFFHFDESPLLVVQTSDIDFVRSPADLADLVTQIKQMRRGKEYYHPTR
ncbi:MAG: deoxynucleoside kinase [Nitrospirae bacterium]|nr:deoxynucleoside kinase [Candidatus Manganitrophaceae bacterium]